MQHNYAVKASRRTKDRFWRGGRGRVDRASVGGIPKRVLDETASQARRKKKSKRRACFEGKTRGEKL